MIMEDFSQINFSQNFNVEFQHWLITMIEKKQRSVDKGGQVGVFLISFSKAFDCIDYDH